MLDSVYKKLNTKLIARNILFYPSLPSTMDTARKMAKGGADEGTVVVADEQTLGRGRLGRRWLSPAGANISLSIILYPTLKQLPQVNMVASLATVQSIKKLTGLKSLIKWPNDILINEKKVSGILIENIFNGVDLRATILGIGINVNLDLSAFAEISDIATSISAESSRKVTRDDVLSTLLNELDQIYQELQQGKNIYRRWLTHIVTLGKLVQIRSGNTVEEGCAESIDINGNLMLRRHDGSITTMITSDATLHL